MSNNLENSGDVSEKKGHEMQISVFTKVLKSLCDNGIILQICSRCTETALTSWLFDWFLIFPMFRKLQTKLRNFCWSYLYRNEFWGTLQWRNDCNRTDLEIAVNLQILEFGPATIILFLNRTSKSSFTWIWPAEVAELGLKFSKHRKYQESDE